MSATESTTAPLAPCAMSAVPRIPTLQACPSFVPDDALAALAHKLGLASASSLARLTVASSACDLWSAVKAYLSHSPVPPGHAPVPLHVASCSKPMDDDATPRVPSYMRDVAGATGVPLARGKVRASRPAFELATSAVDFVWPPPSHLSAETLVRAQIDGDKALGGGGDACCGGGSCGVGDTPATQGQAEEGAEENAEASTIHLFYYTVGEPVGTMDNVAMMQQMMLVSPHGTETLKRFATEVVEWHVAITSVPDKSARFPLFRFKTVHSSTFWKFEGLKRQRPATSVVLAGDQMQTILDDVAAFKTEDMKEWYYEHGLPYRRSFLFYGPPGTGKTSTVRVIASKFALNCCVLNVATKKFSNQDLGDALSSLPGNSLLVLEDVDALFNLDRSNKTDNELTFSGMLNALDGLVSVEGLVTVMTTNHIERLERALIRGGRVDRRFCFDLPADTELQTLFRAFYRGCDDATAQRFAKAVLERPEGDEARAVSTLQQLFIEKKTATAEQVLAGMDAFYSHHFPPEQEANGTSAAESTESA